MHVHFYLYLYKHTNMCLCACLSLCLFVRVFLGHLESYLDTLWQKYVFGPRMGSKTIIYQFCFLEFALFQYFFKIYL